MRRPPEKGKTPNHGLELKRISFRHKSLNKREMLRTPDFPSDEAQIRASSAPPGPAAPFSFTPCQKPSIKFFSEKTVFPVDFLENGRSL